MINVIVYDECNSIRKDIEAINMALVNYNIDYRIYTFSDYNEDLKTIINNKLIKIYVLNVNRGGKGIDVALQIRKIEINSIIIFIADCNKYQELMFNNKLMVLDFICRNKGYEKRLQDDILYALKIIYERKSFVFKYNHIVYRLPYSQINYIEKESAIKRCIIHTVCGNYYVINSIQRLNEILGNNFYRTHQSCIVNLCNIKKIDLINNTIEFNNGDKTILFSDKFKKYLIEVLRLNGVKM